jgi:hypothetical protein
VARVRVAAKRAICSPIFISLQLHRFVRLQSRQALSLQLLGIFTPLNIYPVGFLSSGVALHPFHRNYIADTVGVQPELSKFSRAI